MAQQKKIPMRMCVACREMKPKAELMRIVCTSEGEIFFDGSSKHNGRGAYICKNTDCITKAQKSGALSRAFDRKTDDVLFQKLLAEVDKK